MGSPGENILECLYLCFIAYCVFGIIELKVFMHSQRIRETGIHQVSRLFRYQIDKITTFRCYCLAWGPVIINFLRWPAHFFLYL